VYGNWTPLNSNATWVCLGLQAQVY
jgi:hypothetical protein